MTEVDREVSQNLRHEQIPDSCTFRANKVRAQHQNIKSHKSVGGVELQQQQQPFLSSNMMKTISDREIVS